MSTASKICKQVIDVLHFGFRKILQKKLLSLRFVHELPLTFCNCLPQSSDAFRLHLLKQGVQLVNVVEFLLPAREQYTANTGFSFFLLGWYFAGADAGKTGLIVFEKFAHSFQSICIQTVFPIFFYSEGE